MTGVQGDWVKKLEGLRKKVLTDTDHSMGTARGKGGGEGWKRGKEE